MSDRNSEPRSNEERDVTRVTEEIGSRLRARGVAVEERESPETLVRLLNAVEAFERAVQEQGGDLMVDEPPTVKGAQPDDPRFLLPLPSADESSADYIRRLDERTAAIRGRRPNR